MSRKHRLGEVNCTCDAYKFPHRFGGGRCIGANIPEDTWNKYWGTGPCEECMCHTISDYENICDVVDGRERVTQCPEWQDFVQYNDVRLLDTYWDSSKI